MAGGDGDGDADTVVVRAAMSPPSSKMEERHRYNLQPYVSCLLKSNGATVWQWC